MSDAEPLLVGRSGRLAILRLNRPHALNALSPALVDALIAAARAAADDTSVGAVLLTAEGRAFCAGGDLTAMFEMRGNTGLFRRYIERLQELSRVMRGLSVPTVAALHGHVLAGGFELALEVDIRIAARDVTFGNPDTRLGVPPTSGMSWLLPRLVGEAWARHLLLTGETIDAATAERIGLVTRLVDGASLEAAATGVASDLASYPPLGLQRIREEVAASVAGFEEALARELEAEVECFVTPEFQASLRAFAERRRT